MGKKHRKRYQSKPNPHPRIVMTGRASLKYWPDFELENLQRGDLEFYMFSCSIGRSEEDPGYDHIGGSGYLKARVFDGRDFQLLVMDDLFPDKLHHFSKKEMPLDTFLRCREAVEDLADTELQRGYRLHYEPVEDEEKE